MTRALLAALLVTLLAVPAAVAHRGGDDERKARAGTVVSVDAAAGTVTIRLRDAARLQAGDRVVVEARALAARRHDARREDDDDEVEATGKLTSLSPVTVTTAVGKTVSCVVPAGFSLAGLALGDRVEITCDLVAGAWTLRRIHAEDDDDDRRGDDRSASGRGGGDDDDDDRGDSSGPGGRDDE